MINANGIPSAATVAMSPAVPRCRLSLMRLGLHLQAQRPVTNEAGGLEGKTLVNCFSTELRAHG